MFSSYANRQNQMRLNFSWILNILNISINGELWAALINKKLPSKASKARPLAAKQRSDEACHPRVLPCARRPSTDLQVDFVDPVDIVRRPAEDETAHAGRDADAHEQNLFTGVLSKPLLHMLHLGTVGRKKMNTWLQVKEKKGMLKKRKHQN